MRRRELETVIGRAINVRSYTRGFSVEDVIQEALSIQARRGRAGLPAFVNTKDGGSISLSSFVTAKLLASGFEVTR